MWHQRMMGSQLELSHHHSIHPSMITVVAIVVGVRRSGHISDSRGCSFTFSWSCHVGVSWNEKKFKNVKFLIPYSYLFSSSRRPYYFEATAVVQPSRRRYPIYDTTTIAMMGQPDHSSCDVETWNLPIWNWLFHPNTIWLVGTLSENLLAVVYRIE